MIPFSCPRCKHSDVAPPDHSGRRVTCRRCGAPALVPPGGPAPTIRASAVLPLPAAGGARERPDLSPESPDLTFHGERTHGGYATSPRTDVAPAGPVAPVRADASQPASNDGARATAVAAYQAAASRDPHFAPHASSVIERLAELGQGGMGTVYRVLDRRLGREAALKVIRGAETPSLVRRFLREAQLTAQLDHPAIPPVHEFGTDVTGRHYLLMRVIEGQSLSELIRQHHATHGGRGSSVGSIKTAKLRTLSDLLEVLVKVSEAVGYAHSKGIVHRDLKSENVMVGSFGEVMVMDWGVARELARIDDVPDSDAAPAEAVKDGLTQQGALIGTLGYMPPEQARGESVRESADVFALGAIMCEILTGRPPFSGKDPMALVRATGDGKVTLPRQRRRDVPAELNDLAGAALSIDPEARPTAVMFAGDLRAYLAGRQVSVHHYGLLERGVRGARRHPTLLVAALAVALLAGAVGLIAERARGAAQRAREEQLESNASGLRRKNQELEAAKLETSRQRDLVAQQRDLVEKQLARSLWERSMSLADRARFRDAAVYAAKALAVDDLPEYRVALVRAQRGPWQGPRVLQLESKENQAALLTPDPSRVIALGADGVARLLNVDTGRELRVFPRVDTGGGNPLALSPDGRFLALGGIGGVISVFDVDTGRAVSSFRDAHRVKCLAFSADGKLLASGNTQDVPPAALTIRELARGAATHEIRATTATYYSLSFRPDGSQIALGTDHIEVALCDLRAGSVRTTLGHEGRVVVARFSHDGQWLASGSLDGTIRIWATTPDGLATRETRIVDLSGAVFDLSFSKDDEEVAAICKDGRAYVFSRRTGNLLGSFTALSCNTLGFDFDGTRLVIGHPGFLHVWDTTLVPELPSRMPGAGDGFAVMSADGRSLLAGCAGGGAILETVDEQGTPTGGLKLPVTSPAWGSFSPDGRLVAVRDQEGVVITDAARAESVRIPVTGALYSTALLDDRVALGLVGKLVVGDAQGQRVIASVPLDSQQVVIGVALRAGGREAALATNESLELCTLEPQDRPRRLSTKRYQSVAYSPDGLWLAAGAMDGTVELWSVQDQPSSIPLVGAHSSIVSAMAWSRDGRWLASGGGDGMVVLWDADDRRAQARLPASGSVQALQFLGDGDRLAVSVDGTISIWPLSLLQEDSLSLARRQELLDETERGTGLTLNPSSLELIGR